MFTKLFVPTFVLAIALSGMTSIGHATEAKPPAEPLKGAPTQDGGKKEAKQMDAKTAMECYAACKRLAEFDHSPSKPSKPGLAAAQKADLRRKAGEYCPQAKETGTCDLKCPYCTEAMALSR